MASLTLYYLRSGNWPATQPEDFAVTSEMPGAKLKVVRHGALDCEPSMRGIWTDVSFPDDPVMGVSHLRHALGLDGAARQGRAAVLLGDSICLLRALLRLLEWPDQVDPSPWLDELPAEATPQRLAIERACR